MRVLNKICYIVSIIIFALLSYESYLSIKNYVSGAKNGFYCATSYVNGLNYFNKDEMDFAEDVVGWVNINNMIDSDDPRIRMKCWKSGMRESREHEAKKAAFKAAFIGCSYTLGHGVKAEETMVWRLNDMYPDVCFDNWGVTGWGPAQVYGRIEKLLNDKAGYDLIVYNIMENHQFRSFMPHAMMAGYGRHDFLPVPYAAWNRFGSYKIHFIRDMRWPLENALLTVNYLKESYYKYYTEEYDSPGNRFAGHEESFAELVNRMYKLCSDNDTAFLACVLEDGEGNPIGSNADIRCELINVDMPNGEARLPENRVMKNPDFHPNGRVHAYWAKRFAEWFDGKYPELKAGVKK